MARKIAEDAVEIVLDSIDKNRKGVILESADLLYDLTALWSEIGIHPQDVWDEMARRRRLFGIAEKLRKEDFGDDAGEPTAGNATAAQAV